MGMLRRDLKKRKKKEEAQFKFLVEKRSHKTYGTNYWAVCSYSRSCCSSLVFAFPRSLFPSRVLCVSNPFALSLSFVKGQRCSLLPPLLCLLFFRQLNKKKKTKPASFFFFATYALQTLTSGCRCRCSFFFLQVTCYTIHALFLSLSPLFFFFNS